MPALAAPTLTPTCKAMHNPPMEMKRKMVIYTKSGIVPIDIEVALQPEERARGLMCRTDLGENNGMVFFFNPPEVISMWMKNTPLSLDMLFFNNKAELVSIHERAAPYSEDFISSGVEAMFALEVNAGFVKKHKIQLGDYFLVEE